MIETFDQFINLVADMRKEQKKWDKKHSYITPGREDNDRLAYEKAVDKFISDRKHLMFKEEIDAQGQLFFS